jgi:hypothetical protein
VIRVAGFQGKTREDILLQGFEFKILMFLQPFLSDQEQDLARFWG